MRAEACLGSHSSSGEVHTWCAGDCDGCVRLPAIAGYKIAPVPCRDQVHLQLATTDPGAADPGAACEVVGLLTTKSCNIFRGVQFLISLAHLHVRPMVHKCR